MHPYPFNCRSWRQLRSTTRDLKFLETLAVAVLVMALSGLGRAATVSFSTDPPVVGSIIISNLTGAVPPGGSPNNPPNSNVNDPRYVAYDQPAQGQTFRTGSDPNGYRLLAVTLKHVSYDTFSLVPNLSYTIRVTRPLTTNSLAVIASENAVALEDYSNCSTCNFVTIGGGAAKGAGSGRFITFTFGNPVALSPNTLYGFDVGAGNLTSHYWETDGRDSTPGAGGGTPLDPYTNGMAYSSGLFNGVGDTTMTNRQGDRVFVVALTPGNVLTPPSITRQPRPAALYAGRTAQFTARAVGSTNLVFQWRKDSANLSDGGRITGALTDTLNISNVGAGDVGSYTLVVTNAAGAVTSAPPATLAVVTAPAPSAGYMYAVFTNNALAYWRLNEAVDPSTNPPAYDYIGGRIGTYGAAALKADGPGPSAFPGFESGNSAAQSSALTDQSWVTVPSLDLNTNTVTFTAWIYPIGGQAEFAGLLFTDSGASRAGMAYGDHWTVPSGVGQLTYSWNEGAIRAFPSGLVIPEYQWSFIALVITPTSGTLYLGSGGPLTNVVNAVPHFSTLWDGPAWIGYEPLYSPQRVFNGVIDEVAVFKRSFTLDEVNKLYNIGRGITELVPPSFTGEPPSSQSLYAGRTARFTAPATGSLPLVYRWQKNGVSLANGGNISGAQTDSLTISNVTAADVGAYTLVVTNSAGAITSSPAATLTIAAPSGKAYEAAVRSANPVAYWRLNETGDPSTNTAAFDFCGGFAGRYEVSARNAFYLVEGPRPPDFPELEANNAALELPMSVLDSWVTVPALNLNTNTVTITLWLQPAVEPVNDHAGLFFTREGSSGGNGLGFFYTATNQIGYTWNLGSTETSQFYSGLTPPAGQWSFAALVVEPTRATLYLYNTNGLASATNAIAHIAEAWDGRARIGDDGGYWNDNFPGRIDEVAVFNYALTPAQILDLYNAAFAAPAPSVTLTVQRVGPNVVLSWPQGTLLEANAVTGAWTTNNATSPYTNGPAGAGKFYRVIVR